MAQVYFLASEPSPLNNMSENKTCELDIRLFLRSHEEEKEFTFSCESDTYESLSFSKPIEGAALLEKTGKELYAQFDITVHPKYPCDRCLKEVSKEMNITFKRLYTDTPDTDDIDEKSFPKQDIIPLIEEIYEEIMTQMNFQKLCKDDCKGLCKECGIDLNNNPDHTHKKP